MNVSSGYSFPNMFTLLCQGLFFFGERFLPGRYRDLRVRRSWPEAGRALFFVAANIIFGYFFLFFLVDVVMPLAPQRRFTDMHEFSFWPKAVAQFLLVFLLQDLLIFVEHYLFHRIPFLWRLHKLHHAPVQIDSLVAIQRHPLEGILRAALVWSLSFALAVFAQIPLQIIFLSLLLGDIYNFWAHSNFDQRKIFGRQLRWLEKIFFMPGVHRIHHRPFAEHGNYGRTFCIFDRLFGTYVEDHPGQDKNFGIHPQEAFPTDFLGQLAEPFRRADR